jgi:hypothetical protein
VQCRLGWFGADARTLQSLVADRAQLAPPKTTLQLWRPGTPLQNKLDELWALLNFLMPGAGVQVLTDFDRS